jgi:hypothetical protein
MLNRPWDFKNNQKTIFGVAWKHDMEMKAKTGKDDHTGFTMGYIRFDDAAAFGNYHAGYTGTYAGVSVGVQEMWAGFGELAKLHPNTLERIGQEIIGAPPVGDNFIDYLWNRRGMRDANNQIKSDGPRAPTMPAQVDPISPFELGL